MVNSVGAITTTVTAYRNGDTSDNCLWNIVKNHYNVSGTSEKIKACEAIAECNGFDSINDTIYVGDKIIIPELTFNDDGKITGYVDPNVEQVQDQQEVQTPEQTQEDAPIAPKYDDAKLQEASSEVAKALTSPQIDGDKANPALEMTTNYLKDESVSLEDKQKFIETIYDGVKDVKGYNSQTTEAKINDVKTLLNNVYSTNGGTVSANAFYAAKAVDGVLDEMENQESVPKGANKNTMNVVA